MNIKTTIRFVRGLFASWRVTMLTLKRLFGISEKIVECDVCGCLLFKRNATITSEIAKKYRQSYEDDPTFLLHTYYCKVHAPKEKK